VDVLSSRILLRPADLGRSRRFYRDVLGLAVYREFGSPGNPAMVFFLGAGLLEVSGSSAGPAGNSLQIWLQVRDVHAEHERLAAAGVRVLRAPVTEPWGLIEMWIEDPDGVRIVLVEVPPDHPLQGVTITLTDASGHTQTAVSAADGTFRFSNLPAGTYTLSETIPPGFAQTFPGTPDAPKSYTITLTPGQQAAGFLFLNKC